MVHDWCDVNNHELNASKTKEMIIDFRRNATMLVLLILKDDMVETVEPFKFLGLTISNTLGWDKNTKQFYQKGPTTHVFSASAEEIWSQS